MRSFYKTRKSLAVFLVISLITLGFLALYVPKAFSAPWTVNASVYGTGGTVDPPTQSVDDLGTATINYTENPTYHLDLVTADGVEIPGPYSSPVTITNVTKDLNVVFTFSDTWTISVGVSGDGTAAPLTQEVANGGNAENIVWSPDAHNHIENVTDNGSSMPQPWASPIALTNVTQDHDIGLFFDLDHYTVDASVVGGTGGGINPPTQSVDYGGTATINYTEDPTYHLDLVTADGVEIPGPYSSPVTITNVTKDLDVVFTFSDTWTVTAEAVGSGNVNPPTQEIANGSNAEITWSANPHYHIVSITDNSVVQPEPYVSPYTITNVTADHDVVVTFTIDTYTIAASAGVGGDIDPEGDVTVNYGANRTFNMLPSTGYHVEDILVDEISVGAAPSYEFTNVTANHTIEVSFALNVYTVTASVPGGNGSAIPGTQDIKHGNPAAITISATAGYHISDIDDNGSHPTITNPKSMTYTIDPVTEAHAVTVTFTKDVFAVSASVTGGHGSVFPDSQNVNYGDSADITLTPADHYHVATITDNETLVDGPYSGAYTIDSVAGNHVVVVTFAIDTNTITATAGLGGSISPSGAVAVNYGADQAFIIVPATGYHIVNVLVDSAGVGAVTSYQFTGVVAPHTISAVFAIDTFTVNASVSGSGGSVYLAKTTWDYDESANIFLLPSAGFHVNSITDNGTPISGPYGAIYEIPNVRANHTVVVTFAINTYTIDAAVVAGYGSVSPASQTVTWDSPGSVTITPQAGYHIESITDNGILIPEPYGGTYTIDPVIIDHDIEVAFGTDTQTWYLAEGATANGMQTYVLVQNPGAFPVGINVKFQTDSGEVQGPIDTVPAQSRRTYLANSYLESLNVSTSVTASGGTVVVERAMYGGGGNWAHDSIGTTAPAATWYLAEGATQGGMQTYILVQNPGSSPVAVNIKFQTGTGEAQGPIDTIPAHARRTYAVSDYAQTFNVSTAVTATGNIVVERSMYNAGWTWGTCSIGTSTAATTWYIAEGSTRGGMDTYVLVQNPGGSAVDVDIKFQTDSGQVQGPQASVPAKSRYTVYVNKWVDSLNVSTMVSGSGLIVCERAMYDTAGTWATCTIGAQAPAATWYLAEGCTLGMDTYVLVQNPGGSAVSVDIKFQTGTGQVQGPVDTIPAYTRRTYYANAFVQTKDVSTLVTASGGGVVVERSMYGPGWVWATGSLGYAP